MLTPIEIQGKAFKTGIGYEKKDVDSFIKEILMNYETLYKENVELNDKLNVLSEGIQYYKTIEKTLQKALVLAEKTAEETQAAAAQKAKAIEQDAYVKADLIVADAKNELDKLHRKTLDLMHQYELYKAQFKQLAAAQIDLIESDSFQIHVANLDAFLSDYQEAAASIDEEKTEERYDEEDSELEQEALDAFQFTQFDD